MGTIHFVYAVPPAPPASLFFRSRVSRALSRAQRVLDKSLIPRYRAVEIKVRRGLGKFPIPRYRYGLIPIRYTPLFAPYSITVNLYRYLSDRYPTMLYDLLETGSIKLEKDDILLGHPNRDPSTIVQQTFRNGYNSKCKALIFPLHHGIPAINEYAIPLIDQADIVFGIMGQYWYDTIDTSFLAPWKHKIVRLDMAIDTIEYPLVKHHFNPPGRRGYLYIGSNRPEKGCSILARTMAELNDYQKGWIGSGPDIPNVPRIATYVDLTPKFVSLLAKEYDFFINTSISDANPTTILEAMAWGFPVVCTPQSGYYNIPSITSLSTTNIQANVKTLLELQNAPEQYLSQLSSTNRRLVEIDYTWERFCTTVWEELKTCISA